MLTATLWCFANGPSGSPRQRRQLGAMVKKRTMPSNKRMDLRSGNTGSTRTGRIFGWTFQAQRLALRLVLAQRINLGRVMTLQVAGNGSRSLCMVSVGMTAMAMAALGCGAQRLVTVMELAKKPAAVP